MRLQRQRERLAFWVAPWLRHAGTVHCTTDELFMEAMSTNAAMATNVTTQRALNAVAWAIADHKQGPWR